MAQPAEVSETHISVVTFIGDRAYKLKKPVRTDFLDFSTRALRERMCHREVELNRRLAPDVYVGVADVRIDGAPVDHLVVMRRMPSDRRLSRLLDEPATVRVIEDLAREIARFHSVAARSEDADRAATANTLLDRWSASDEELARFTTAPPRVLAPDDVAAAYRLAAEYLHGRTRAFDVRIAAGRAVDGHGDLQCDDIFVLDDGPRILDCIEFADEYRYGDVLADVAFLAMDLERLGHPELARAFLDHYQQLSGDRWPRSLEHHHIAYRAHVRAKVACLRVEQGDATAAPAARSLLALALEHLHAGRVRAVLVGGAPGSGKTTVASAVADRLGAVLLSTDELRKDLAGIAHTSSAAAPLHEGLYAPAKVRRVYRELVREASALIAHGESVVLDATWSDAEARAVARKTLGGVAALSELQCCAPETVAFARVASRRPGENASDATEPVARAIAAAWDPWPTAIVIDTSGPPDAAVARALGTL